MPLSRASRVGRTAGPPSLTAVIGGSPCKPMGPPIAGSTWPVAHMTQLDATLPGGPIVGFARTNVDGVVV